MERRREGGWVAELLLPDQSRGPLELCHLVSDVLKPGPTGISPHGALGYSVGETDVPFPHGVQGLSLVVMEWHRELKIPPLWG